MEDVGCTLAGTGEACSPSPRLRRGMCSRHYRRWLEQRESTGRSTCAIEGCGGEVNARGLCNRHYLAAKTAGALEDFPTAPRGMAAFWPKVDKTSTCWLWTANRNVGGYGTFWTGSRHEVAHRVAYEAIRGPIPEGMQLDHICRVRHCVNPDHLEPVTGQVNTLRGISFAAINARKTHCKHGHEFTAENTRLDQNGNRACIQCSRDRARAQRRRKKAARAAARAMRTEGAA